MAPETAMGKELTGLADIYSLACTFYMALTGEHVFDAPTPMAVMLKHIQDEPPNIQEVAKFDTPKGFADVLMSCMDKEPANRPSSALDLYQRLDKLENEWDCQKAQDWWVSHVDLDKNENYSKTMSENFKTMLIDSE